MTHNPGLAEIALLIASAIVLIASVRPIRRRRRATGWAVANVVLGFTFTCVAYLGLRFGSVVGLGLLALAVAHLGCAIAMLRGWTRVAPPGSTSPMA